MHAGIGGAKQAFHLAELGVGLLELGRTTGKHVEAIVVAHGHLVGQATEIPGQGRHPLRQLQASVAQLRQRR
jgi:hypothetical protein